MARHRMPINETLRWELFREYCLHAEASHTLPNPHVFHAVILPDAGYRMSWPTFRDHWKELQLDGLIRIDKRTGAVEIVKGQIITPLEDI